MSKSLEELMNPDLTLFIDRMNSHPEEFLQDKYCLVHKPSGVHVWTKNGADGTSFYEDSGSPNSFDRDFSIDEKKEFWKAYEFFQKGNLRKTRKKRDAMMRKYFTPLPPPPKKTWRDKYHRVMINLKRMWRILWS